MRMQEHGNKLDTNVKGVSKKFGIGNAAKIIAILRDKLYERKIPTLVQEYICNARDAMREVGKGNDFEITVPTRLNPVFKVKDFGPGLSPDRVENVFIMYGSSTKDDSDEQTGGFGIGAKSAWSYTDSFTIVSIVDGIRRTYVAHTGTNSEGSLDLITTDLTDECNGTEIQVAVKPYDIEEFRKAVFRAIYFWDVKPKLKGELDSPTLVRGHVISDLVEVIDQNVLPEYIRLYNYGDILAVIDGIPYVINSKLSSKLKQFENIGSLLNKRLVLHFGNGVVDVSASRESISDSPQTIAGLEKVGKRALIEIQTHISKAFGKVKDTAGYLKTYAEMSQGFNVDKFAKFGDYSIASGFVKSDKIKKVRITIAHCMGRSGRHRVEKVTKDELSEARKEIEIANFDCIFFSNQKDNKIVENKRIREFLKTKNRIVILELMHTNIPVLDKAGKAVLDAESKPTFKPVTYNKEFDQVVSDLAAKDFQSITYVDPPKVVKAKVKREDAEICLHAFGGDRHKYTTLASNTEKWFFVPLKGGSWPDTYTNETLKELNDYLREVEGARICGVAERAAKMIAGNKNFSPLSDWLDNFTPGKETLMAVKAKTLAKNAESIEVLSGLKDLDDEFLVEAVKEYKSLLKGKVSHVPEILTEKVLKTQEARDFKEMDETLGKLIKNEYPLVTEIGRYTRHKDELVFYMNAKYNGKKGKK